VVKVWIRQERKRIHNLRKYTARMAMGRRAKQGWQERFWVASTDLPQTAAHPFYERLNQLLEEGGFDEFVEQQCASFYAERWVSP